MSHQAFKIGILLPTSLIYRDLGERLLAGIATYLQQSDSQIAGRRIELVSEIYGTSQILAEEKGKKLLSWDQVDLIVALMSVNLASSLFPLLSQRPIPMIVGNLGENIPRTDEEHPLVCQHTLGLWQANWVLGRWAAETIGPRAMACQSFYDSGFDLPYAFRLGYEGAGGQILHTTLTHVPPDRGTFGPFFTHANEVQPDLIFASYCGSAAEQLRQAYHDSGLVGSVPLLGSGYLYDPFIVPNNATATPPLITARSWDTLISTTAGCTFVAAYESQHSTSPDGFALLGFEIAQRICLSLEATHGDSGAAPLSKALVQAEFESPRGHLRSEAGRISGHSISVQQVEVQFPQMKIERLAEQALPQAADTRFADIRRSVRSGWMNTYLSV